ncbi:alginate lyase family protein [Mucilaginibacter sp. HMF5004]|uniref:alginate lyase family protein n=1 Tax=Mucilaginibacter rivuli TaxID=2857527 RepID=UPI001C5D63D1|nr:alginate lyase family protein [Mucilaginibacter rivuli]MBW4888572.1 alginate lyase family protein [Mucilaginibacter rivuli]
MRTKLIYPLLFAVLLIANAAHSQQIKKEITATLRPYVLTEAALAMTEKPITITTESCSRSAGGKHDFYSEGDYWWPNPKSPDSPYVQRDGLTNPQNFVAHRLAMIRFSRLMGALASAYKLTGDNKYVKQASKHLNAWFINPETMMNPNLLYSQAIKGVATGRGIGVIDAIQLMEVVKGTEAMQTSSALSKQTLEGVKAWFSKYLTWVTTHKYGVDEMNAKNNHGTCWTMQVACFAKFTNNAELLSFCRNRYKTVLLPEQMAADGSFPLELKRTKPYGYSIFDLDAMCTICQLLSTATDNLWKFETPDGRSINKGIAFLYPYLKDKNAWPYPHDVMYWDEWPAAQPSLVFGALEANNTDWLKAWVALNHAPTNAEIIRNLPVRHPLIWLN